MSTNTEKYGSSISNLFIVAPIETADIPLGTMDDLTLFTDFIKYDEDGNAVSRYSLNEYIREVNPSRKLMLTADGKFFYFGWGLSDLKGNIKDLKLLFKAYGYVLGGESFNNSDSKACWILNSYELDEWLQKTVHNNIEITDEEPIE